MIAGYSRYLRLCPKEQAASRGTNRCAQNQKAALCARGFSHPVHQAAGTNTSRKLPTSTNKIGGV